MFSFKPAFSLSSFHFINRLFSSSSLSAIRLISSAYLAQSLIGVSASLPGSWCTQGFVCALQEFLVGKKGLNDADNHDDVVTH